MEFKRDIDETYYFTHSSPDGLMKIGIYRVMFGYRVRVWSDYSVYVDWCCGDSSEFVEKLFNLLLNYFIDKPEEIGAVKMLPLCSDIKPAWNDKPFMDHILGLVDGTVVIQIPIDRKILDFTSLHQGLQPLVV